MAYSYDNTPADKSLDIRHISQAATPYDNEAGRKGFFSLQFGKDSFANVFSILRTGPALSQDTDGIRDQDGNIMNDEKLRENLSLNVTKFDEVFHKLNTLEFRRGNDVVKFAGVPTFNAGTLVVDDMIGTNTKEILTAWYYLAYNPKTRKGGRMKDYKKDATLVEYAQDYTVVRAWTIHGCWISSLDSDGFDKENDGKKQINATIEYDWAEPFELTTTRS